MQLNWQIKSFQQLSLSTLYGILKLRQAVFMLEQNSLYEDLDNLDQIATHFIISQNGVSASLENSADIIAYLRLLPKQKLSIEGDDVEVTVLGRFALAPSVRGTGLAKILFNKAIELAKQQSPQQPIKISAQAALLDYYAAFGFQAFGDLFDDGGVEHINMLLT